MKTGAMILASAGDTPPERVDQLTRPLNGLAFSNLSIGQPGGNVPAGLTDGVLDSVSTT
ncbi:hypothetical protein [Mycolicibacterium sarraceniae]|uniref:Uncharacterized protein n=1 Tax=Mycolicibacterium sarraceniae TaxID=1534348 RepID=A0A7I7SNJ3_9MYCO|nr:hypothetical protein [Mycolicibacterium sarraceniae]BBY58110.1 hypothetical protein MSAR_12460 [Mycolicibacterium sarraceniae]